MAAVADVATATLTSATMAQRDILIRIGGSVLDTQFTRLVSIMKIESAEAAICAHDFVRLQSATENLKSEIATRV